MDSQIRKRVTKLLVSVGVFAVPFWIQNLFSVALWVTITISTLSMALYLGWDDWLGHYPTLQRRKNYLVGFSVLIAAAIGIICNGNIVNETVTSDADSEAKADLFLTEKPHTQSTLTIDSFEFNEAAFHLTIQNIGTLRIENLRYDVRAPNVRIIDPIPANPRDLPPKGRLRVEGTIKNGLAPQSILTSVFTFTSEIGGQQRDFTSRSKFLIPAGPLVKQTLDPFSSEELTGDFVAGKTIESIRNAFDESSPATVTFWIPETADGKPQILIIENDNRFFMFNAVSREVIFSGRESGKIKTLRLSFDPTNDNYHFVGLSWGPFGNRLYVDAKRAN